MRVPLLTPNADVYPSILQKGRGWTDTQVMFLLHVLFFLFSSLFFLATLLGLWNLGSWPGTEHGPQQWKHQLLITGQPWNSQVSGLFKRNLKVLISVRFTYSSIYSFTKQRPRAFTLCLVLCQALKIQRWIKHIREMNALGSLNCPGSPSKWNQTKLWKLNTK